MSLGKIIDSTNSDFEDVPASLEGEVLLARTTDARGNHSGFLTCPLDVFIAMKKASPAERAAGGWHRHAALLDTADVADLRARAAAIATKRGDKANGQ